METSRRKHLKRLDMYLNWGGKEPYKNTIEEDKLVNQVMVLYTYSKGEREKNPLCKKEKLEQWRKAYKGILGALDKDGNESVVKGRTIRKLLYEIVESKISNVVPAARVVPRHREDITIAQRTEDFLRYDSQETVSKLLNDRAERATYIDGTVWYKVWWDPNDSKYDRAGNCRVEECLVDQITPQPNVFDYRLLEYIFEEREVSVSRLYDTYGRYVNIRENGSDSVKVISFYYLNENRTVGHFCFIESTLQVMCNEDEWLVKRVRECTRCKSIVPTGDVCTTCGSKTFKNVTQDFEILEEDIEEVYNPYLVGETNDPKMKDELVRKVFIPKSTKIPVYKIRRLPFVPRCCVAVPNEIYGMGDGMIVLESQDMINKMTSRALEKVISSFEIVSHPQHMNVGKDNEPVRMLGTNSPDDVAMLKNISVKFDVSSEMAASAQEYIASKQATGITDSFQGRAENAQESGKSLEIKAIQSAGRIESTRVAKNASLAAIYEIKVLFNLAFSSESRKFTKVLSDGKTIEESWNKYSFLKKEKNGTIYYEDDFLYFTDAAASVASDIQTMWQLVTNDFIQGKLGELGDKNTLESYWNIMDKLDYPVAPMALAAIKDNRKKLPSFIEEALIENPEVLQIAAQLIQEKLGQEGGTGERGGDSEAQLDGTKASQVARRNARTSAAASGTEASVEKGGGMNSGYENNGKSGDSGKLVGATGSKT